MELSETEHQHLGGIHNYFQGATIHNIVINGNMTKLGSDNYSYESSESKQHISAEQLAETLQRCGDYMWSNAAYSVVFCVCRDGKLVENNAASFERLLKKAGVTIADGTINNAMSRNVWMKYHIDKWEELGVKERVLRLKDSLVGQLCMMGLEVRKSA